MSRGGARNRSGPPKQEGSRTSDREGFILTALPPAGYDDDAPTFPLSRRSVFRWEFEDKRKFQVFDAEATEAIAEREAELWAWAWATPQACAWSLEPWRWPTVAMWVRTFVICESSDATAADKGSLHRFADQIGMTPAGLTENGWKIAELPKADDQATPDEADDEDDPRNRLSVVRDGTGG
jgi:hypothetical protein